MCLPQKPDRSVLTAVVRNGPSDDSLLCIFIVATLSYGLQPSWTGNLSRAKNGGSGVQSLWVPAWKCLKQHTTVMYIYRGSTMMLKASQANYQVVHARSSVLCIGANASF